MSIWFVLAILATALSVLLVLDAAARWNHSTGIVLAEYDRLLKSARERAETERAGRARTALGERQTRKPDPTDGV